MLDGGRRARATILGLDADTLHVLGHHISRNMLGEHVRRVVSAKAFGETKVPFAHAILDPKVGGRQMTNPPKSSSATYADRCGGIGQDFEIKLESKVWSRPSDWRPKPMEAPRQIPPSSASPEDKATVVWVTDQCSIQCPPLIATPPEVDRRVTWQPPKSVSTKVLSVASGFWKSKRYTNRGSPTRKRIASMPQRPFSWERQNAG